MSYCDPEHGCITCGDHAVAMRVLRVDEGRVLALCETQEGERSSVEIGLVDPVAPGDELLVHAGTALQRIAPSAILGYERLEAERRDQNAGLDAPRR